MQRRHHADLRGAVETCEHDLAKALVEIADRRPVGLAVAAIDVGDETRDLVLEVTIGLDGTARGICDLQQRDAAQELRMLGPEPVERADTVDEALGIVEPVDADREPLTVEAAA